MTYICPICNGEEKESKREKDKLTIYICNFCHGKKELDWIENIVGCRQRKHIREILSKKQLEEFDRHTKTTNMTFV